MLFIAARYPVAPHFSHVRAVFALVFAGAFALAPAFATTQAQPDAPTPEAGKTGSQIANGAPNNAAKYTLPNGYVYEGSLSNNLFEGEGKLSTPDQEYTGSFREGVYSGHGTLLFKGGATYTGDFAAGAFQGKGRFETPDASVFEGEFKEGKFEGAGTFERHQGGRHVGAFKDWKPEGPGKFTDTRGNTYEGSFAGGELKGKGVYIGKDGTRYEGQFKGWSFNGEGFLRTARGDEYRGGFKYGMYDGEGEMRYATPQKDGRTRDSGTWHYGRLEDPQAEERMARNVETALYTQGALLDATLAALQPHRPGKINMYLMAVGGDGGQEVFRRETEFVQHRFDRDFDTAGHSLVLVNSRSTIDKYPMATQKSIQDGLKTVASRMDKDNDILFLFLTSHGSRTHELLLDQDGMNLRSLPAEQLGKWLKESGIRWTVVLVSACYSGGFIDPLKDDHTLVITAARKDRTSFGCADDSEFTYFSQAYFQDALPRSASFGEAFEKAKLLVTEREAADFKKAEEERAANKDAADEGDDADEEEKDSKEEKPDPESRHSEPQIHKGKAIEQYLKKWRAQLPMVQAGPASVMAIVPEAAEPVKAR
jgi:hypothetical protein